MKSKLIYVIFVTFISSLFYFNFIGIQNFLFLIFTLSTFVVLKYSYLDYKFFYLLFIIGIFIFNQVINALIELIIYFFLIRNFINLYEIKNFYIKNILIILFSIVISRALADNYMINNLYLPYIYRII